MMVFSTRRVLLASALAASMLSLVSCSQEPEADSADEPTPNRVPATNVAVQPAAAALPSEELKPQIKRVLGKWLRADGGYMLEISGGRNDGQLTAAYFNPNPIRVSKAMAIVEGETTKVFIELQDIGYPGCTYSLLFDPKSDQLYGQYFQAAQHQTYDVTFEKYKPRNE